MLQRDTSQVDEETAEYSANEDYPSFTPPVSYLFKFICLTGRLVR